MEKSTKPITANPVWLTELTDTEMEATAGGRIVSAIELNRLLGQYKAGNITLAQIEARAEQIKPREFGRQVRIYNAWEAQQSSSDRRLLERIGRRLGIT
jgi:hypothetical protein